MIDSLEPRVCRAAVLAAFLVTTMPANSQPSEWRSIAAGGRGGEPFEVVCPRYAYLSGVRTRIGEDMDAIGIMCSRVGQEGVTVGLFEVGDLYGGGGGNLREGYCGERTPVVRSLEVRSEGVQLLIVDGVKVTCGPLTGPVPRTVLGYSEFHLFGLPADLSTGPFQGNAPEPLQQELICPPDMVPAGIHGRAGRYVDSVGIICRDVEVEPPPPPPPPTLQSDRPMINTGIDRAQAAPPTTAGPIANAQLEQTSADLDRISALRANELLCRGGDFGLPSGRWGQVPGKPDREWHIINVLFSEAPAQADGSGLAPGRCGFPNGGSERVIQMTLETAPDEGVPQRIAAQLRDAGSYYRFLLRHNAEMNWYEVIDHGPWTPPATAAHGPTAAGAAAGSPIQGAAQPTPAAAAAQNVSGNIPLNLFSLDDAAVIVIGGRPTPAGEVKRSVRAELSRLPEPTRRFALCSVGAESCSP